MTTWKASMRGLAKEKNARAASGRVRGTTNGTIATFTPRRDETREAHRGWYVPRVRAPTDLAIDPDVARAHDSLPNKVNELGYDAWGFHRDRAKIWYSIGKRLLTPYFRPRVTGLSNLPEGRVLIVPNHSGQLPIDGMIIALTCLLHAEPPRLVRAMVERWFPKLPFVNELFVRCGAVLGDPVNCRNLLLDDQAIVVFPEGVKGSGKTWKHRYELQPFGRGFMRLALQTNAPIVPCAVVGGEESIISLHDWKRMARLLGMPYLPITPLPFPLPVRFHVHFGEPLRFDGRYDDEDAMIDEKVKRVTEAIERLLRRGLAERTSLF
jgi:1-acyl-sn-glycerol-3-phosphate acyltransferase